MTARLLLANQLRALDEIDWSLVSGDAYEDPPPWLKVEVIPVRRELSASDVIAALRMWRFFRREAFGFVQTHTQKASLLGLPTARLSGTFAVYTVHGALYFPENAWLANVLGWAFEKWCCTWANRVLVQSAEDGATLPRSHVCRAEKIRYVGNGVAMQRFLEPVEPALRSEIPIVVMVSRLVREKGCADYVDLARHLAGKATFVHVGPQEHDQSDALSEKELAAADEYVSFVGPVHDVRPYLAAADIVVLPSYREGIPRVAMEAAACGKPVAGYDIRGMREVVDPGSGLLVPRGHVSALEDLVADLLDDPEKRKALGEACLARVKDTFSEDRVIERLRAVYAEICPEARHPVRAASRPGS